MEHALTSTPTRALRGLAGFGLAVAVAGLSTLAAVSAQAAPAEPRAATSNTTIPINPGNLPATAAGYGEPNCDQVGPSADQDGWVFVLPGNEGRFVSLTLKFETPEGESRTLRIPDDGGTIGQDNGTHKAWIRTAPGWTLVAASAVITGSSANGKFNLTHTCPATGGSPSPSPSQSTAPSESPSTPGESPSTPGESPSTPGESPTGSPSGSPGTSTEPTVPPSPTADVPDDGGELPTTGLALGGVVALGVALVGAGFVLRAVKRRRDLTDTPAA